MVHDLLWRMVIARRRVAASVYVAWLRMLGMQIAGDVLIEPSVYVSEPSKISIGSRCDIRRGALLNGRSQFEVGISLGTGVHIHPFACLDAYGGSIVLGDDVRIGHYSVIAGHGGVRFGAFSGVAGHSYVIAANHQFKLDGTPHVLQPETRRGISIGENVWGGNGVIILDGVTIGDNCVIGAGSVVRRNVPPNSVVLGNPARVAYRL